MTSATAGSTANEPSQASKVLEYILGKHRVALSELFPHEFNAFLTEQLDSVDTRELYGFTEMRDIFRELSNDFTLYVGANVNLTLLSFEGGPLFGLKSHVIHVCKGMLGSENSIRVYRQHESGKETRNMEEFRTWGRSGYLYGGTDTIMLMVRSERPSLRNLLVEVYCSYTKIANENKYLIENIVATAVHPLDFSKRYKEKAPRIASSLIWDIAAIYRQTAEGIEQRAKSMREKSVQREMIASRVG